MHRLSKVNVVVVAVVWLASLSPLAPLASTLHAQPIIAKKVFPLLRFASPVDLQDPRDGTNRLFIVRQRGIIDVVVNAETTSVKKTFLNIDPIVISGGEMGLLGLAFHPDYENNGYFYVNYTRDTSLRTVISRFTVSGTNPDSANAASEMILMEILQPYTNHNGGQLAFGPDGYLYIALGDGGSGGDPEDNGQDRTALLGKLLRIDVDSTQDTLNYAIPPDNPYAGNIDGYREEIYAWGLRNPWRFSFDALTGLGWIADVGQNDWEEVDTLTIGGNYGWRFKEADHCYNPPAGCDTIGGLIDPVWEYPHVDGEECSITGGYVYRGDSVPSLAGKYLYGDYCSGRIWTFDRNGAGPPTNELLLETGMNILSFGTDRNNEFYICSRIDSSIYRLVMLHPPAPGLLSPGEGETVVPPDPFLLWAPTPSAVLYHLQVAEDAGFTMMLVSDSTVTDTSFLLETDTAVTTYHWRVRARNTQGWGPYSPSRWFSTATGHTAYYSIDPGWNMISLPLDSLSGVVASMFPSAVSSAFEYVPDVGYVERDTLSAGVGYWLKFGKAKAVGLTGSIRLSLSVPVAVGWNLIGTLSEPISIDDVASAPPGIVDSPFYDFDVGYLKATTLEPMRAYWVKVSAPGTLMLEVPPPEANLDP